MDSKDLEITSFLDEIKPTLILQPIIDSHWVLISSYKQTQKKCEVFSSVQEHLWDYLVDNYLDQLIFLFFQTEDV